MNIETTESPDKNDVDVLLAGLNDYNYSLAPRDWRELGVFFRSDGTVCGGAYGASVWDWVHIKFLWVHPDHRQAGLGTRIMREVEEEAVRRGCIGIHLDTYSFQALRFYQKIGFEVFGQVDEHPRGHKRHYLKKLLKPAQTQGTEI